MPRPGRRRASRAPGRTTSIWKTAAIATCKSTSAPEGEVRGLELEDTVAIYDTIDGSTCVEPSNRVCLYCAALRRGAASDERVAESAERSADRRGDAGQAGIAPGRAAGHDRDCNRSSPRARSAASNPASSGCAKRAMPAISRQPIAALAGRICHVRKPPRDAPGRLRGIGKSRGCSKPSTRPIIWIARSGRAGRARRPAGRRRHRATSGPRPRSASTCPIIPACG